MGSSVDEMEIYNRSLLSLKLLGTCTFLWTVLVCTYFFSAVGPTVFPTLEDRIDVSALTMVGECTMDVVAKVLYMFIIVDVHDQVFDQSARAERRLEELRQMMAVVWDNSSDVIGISVRSINGNVTTMLSEYMQFLLFCFCVPWSPSPAHIPPARRYTYNSFLDYAQLLTVFTQQQCPITLFTTPKVQHT